MTTETKRFKMNGHWFQRLPAILIISQMWMAIVISAQNLAMSSTTPTLVHSALGATSSNSLNNCSTVKSLFEKQGLSAAELPIQPIAGKCLFFLVLFRFRSVKFPQQHFSFDISIFSLYLFYFCCCCIFANSVSIFKMC